MDMSELERWLALRRARHPRAQPMTPFRRHNIPGSPVGIFLPVPYAAPARSSPASNLAMTTPEGSAASPALLKQWRNEPEEAGRRLKHDPQRRRPNAETSRGGGPSYLPAYLATKRHHVPKQLPTECPSDPPNCWCRLGKLGAISKYALLDPQTLNQ